MRKISKIINCVPYPNIIPGFDENSTVDNTTLWHGFWITYVYYDSIPGNNTPTFSRRSTIILSAYT